MKISTMDNVREILASEYIESGLCPRCEKMPLDETTDSWMMFCENCDFSIPYRIYFRVLYSVKWIHDSDLPF